METNLSPGKILQTGLAFWNAKTLLSAVELGLFTQLAKGPLSGEALRERLGLHPRSWRDFFDSLVAMGLLAREDGSYANTPEADWYLDRNKPSYVGGILEMANARLYANWGELTRALKTGQPENEAKEGEDLFAALYADPERLKSFLHAMTGLSLETGKAIAREFPWREHRRFFDVGCAQGGVPVQVASAHPHLSGGGFDLPPVGPIFEAYVRSHGLQDRLRFHSGDFMKDPLPEADVLIMGHILHDWDLDEKKMLLRKAFAALPNGGALIVHEALIDDERRENVFGLLMSLNMLIETRGGFDFTGADGVAWMREAGFREAYVRPLAGPNAMLVGVK